MTRLLPRTLLWQVGLALIALQVAVFGGLAVYGYRQVTEFHRNQKEAELLRLAEVAAGRIAPLVAAGDGAGLDDTVYRLGRTTGVRISVIAPDGTVMADSHADAPSMGNHGDRPEIRAALRLGVGSSRRTSATLGLDMLYFARALVEGDETVAVVRTALPTREMDRQLAGLLRAIGVAALVSLFLTVAVFYLISRRLSRTVLSLAHGARRFAAGHLEHRIERPAGRELARLADALNAMARRLGEQIQQIERQRGEQDAILQSMGLGVIALDSARRILSVNRAAASLVGIDTTAARGRLLPEVLREPAVHAMLADAADAGSAEPCEFETEVGGEETCLEARCEVLRGTGDDHPGLLLLLHDVTEFRRLERIRSDFAANVSHELRTPITNVKGYIETLIDHGGSDPEQVRRFLEVAHRNADRLAAIIEDIMALARLERPGAAATLPRVPTSLVAILRGAIEAHASEAAAKGIEVTADIEDDRVVPVHRQLIEQAIGNLLSNAIRYSPPRTRVTVRGRVEGDDDSVIIEVADEGPGIAPEHLPRLFERFYRIDKARSRELGGTGLGLAIVKHVANVHGGRTEVESTVGQGSTFRIVLPAA